MEQIIDIAIGYAIDVVGAIVILIAGLIAAKWAKSCVVRATERSDRLDPILGSFFGSAVRYLVLIVTVMMVLAQFGIQTASLVAVLGASGLAIGLALQGTLSNVAAGVMLLVFRPFKLGDFVEIAGHAGSAKAVTLFVTELVTPDNVQVVIPNGQVWGAAVKNYSFHKTRRVDLNLGIGYDDDIAGAKTAVESTIAADKRVLGDPAPMVAVAELADSSVNFVIRVWCASADYWDLKFDLTRALKERMDQDGYNIPYPQQTVHMIQQSD